LINLPAPDKPAIVLAPYGTLHSAALATYDRIRAAYERAFPGSPIRMAFTSRLMIERLREKEGISVPSLPAALAELHDLGCERAVVQSLQIVPGGEFHQAAALVQALQSGAKPCSLRLAVGLPLLSGLPDCRRVASILPSFWGTAAGANAADNTLETRGREEAVLLVGHGTGHPADALYSLLAHVLKRENRDVFLGTIEGYPGLPELVPELKGSGAGAVRLLPFLLVAGGHAQNDISGQSPSSWKSVLEREGFSVSVDLRGLGEFPEIVSLFLEHTRSALSKMEI
jgi:sirohydrochlorin cobaltochelatase